MGDVKYDVYLFICGLFGGLVFDCEINVIDFENVIFIGGVIVLGGDGYVVFIYGVVLLIFRNCC